MFDGWNYQDLLRLQSWTKAVLIILGLLTAAAAIAEWRVGKLVDFRKAQLDANETVRRVAIDKGLEERSTKAEKSLDETRRQLTEAEGRLAEAEKRAIEGERIAKGLEEKQKPRTISDADARRFVERLRQRRNSNHSLRAVVV